MIGVIDASVAIKWVLADESNANAQQVLQAILKFPGHFAIPELFPFEILSVLGRIHPNPQDAFLAAISPVIHGGILRFPMTDALAKRVLEYVQQGLTGYDAAYIGLAEELGGCWITFDTKAIKQVKNKSLCHDLGKRPWTI